MMNKYPQTWQILGFEVFMYLQFTGTASLKSMFDWGRKVLQTSRNFGDLKFKQKWEFSNVTVTIQYFPRFCHFPAESFLCASHHKENVLSVKCLKSTKSIHFALLRQFCRYFLLRSGCKLGIIYIIYLFAHHEKHNKSSLRHASNSGRFHPTMSSNAITAFISFTLLSSMICIYGQSILWWGQKKIPSVVFCYPTIAIYIW